jgi:zinc transport system substrate-binding protein
LDPSNKAFYEQNLVKYIFRIRHLEEQISKRARLKYNGKKIVCNNQVADFMQWLGCDVVAEYGKAETVSSAQMLRISKKIKDNKVKVVIDNLQSGTDIGKTLAKDLKTEQVVISNFPLNYSYIETLKENVLKLDKVLQ